MGADPEDDPRDSDGRPLPYPNCPLCQGVGIIFSPDPEDVGEYEQTVCSCLDNRIPRPMTSESEGRPLDGGSEVRGGGDVAGDYAQLSACSSRQLVAFPCWNERGTQPVVSSWRGCTPWRKRIS